MIIDEPVVETKMRRVLRCDKCCKAVTEAYDRQYVRVITFSKWTEGGVKCEGKYHLCETCAASLQYDYDANRKRIREGVTPAEQEALLVDLFIEKGKKQKRKRLGERRGG